MPDATADPRLSMAASPKQNHLLHALDAADYARLRPHLEHVHLPLGMVVCASGMHADHAYFPTTSIVSLLYDLENGSSVEISVTGNDGLVGISRFMGGGTSAGRTVVRSAGHAYRVPADTLAEAFEEGGSLRHLLLRYTHALITQMAQTAVCNRCHRTEQRLCRSLLSSLDRLPTNELPMTHELIANVLGVRRESVTVAAGKLQAAGMIRCSRGRITVLDRRELEQRVCECYAVVKAELDRLLLWRTPESLARAVLARAPGPRPALPVHPRLAPAYAAAAD